MPNSTLRYINFTTLGWGQLVVGSCLALAPLVSHAQGRAAVSSTLTNAAGAPQQYVTVTLHRAADSVVVKTEYTDQQGAFQLAATSGGRYLVSAGQAGFRRYWSPVFVLPATGLVLPAIRLVASSPTALADVTVTGHKPLYERRADRTVVNVADSPLAAGSTTLDVLGRAPSVTLNSDNDLRLRGREAVLVYVDSKRVPLTGNDLADYLRALPAEQIQTIELITSPPASYDAQGSAGVIDIKLKKDQRLGLNGSVNASYGRGVYGKFVGGGTLNYRRKNLNLYGTYAYSDRRDFTRLTFERQYVAAGSQPAASSQQYSERLPHLQSHSAKMGLDLTISKRTTLGVALNGLASQTGSITTSNGKFMEKVSGASSSYTSQANQNLNRPSGSANLNLRHTFADSATASTISADVDYARYYTSRLLDLFTNYEMPTKFTSLLHGDQDNTLDIGTARVDYSQPLPHRARLEAGAKVTQVVNNSDAQFASTANGSTKLQQSISYPFRYRENVYAAYVNYSGATAKTTWQVGLRAEKTNTVSDTSGVTLQKLPYSQLFPNVQVQHTFSKNHALALSIARRIDRPSYSQLNPLRFYIEATSYITGNPYLRPPTSYNFELTHTYKGKYSIGLAYARTNLPIVNAVQPSPDGGRVVVNQDVNLDTRNFYTLTLTAPVEIANWWVLDASGLLYYNQYQGYLNGNSIDRGGLAYNLKVASSFTLPHGWAADLSGLYESKEVYNFQHIQDRGQVAIGFQKSLWNKQATLRLNVADVFYTTPLHVTSTYDNFSETYYQRYDTRVVTAAFTYRFGNGKVAAARKRTAGAEEELRRAGTNGQ